MTSQEATAGSSGASTESAGPARPAAVLGTLILVAAIANLPLAVANVALPDDRPGLRRLPDPTQPRRRGLLARPGGVGAVARRRRGSLRAQVDAADRSAAVVARLPGGGVGAEHRGADRCPDPREASPPAWPTRRPWRSSRPCGRGPGRTKSIALWSAIGGAMSALGPLIVGRPARALLVGVGLPRHAPSHRGRRSRWPGSSCRPTSTRPLTRSTTWAGSCRRSWSARSSWPSTSPRCPIRARWCSVW